MLSVGLMMTKNIGIYRFENKLIEGNGKLSFRNVEGLAGAPRSVKDSITAAFNYFIQNSRKLIDGKYDDFDYSLYYNDLQNRKCQRRGLHSGSGGSFLGSVESSCHAVTCDMRTCGNVWRNYARHHHA